MNKELAEKMYYLNTNTEYSYTVFALSVIYDLPQSVVRTLIEQGRELSSKQDLSRCLN